ncbi:MAG: hypothetical protein FJ218_00915 [Ignavibacteria bacterium]|nr:hypothetical protein [Ignavibacteria bacterium]
MQLLKSQYNILAEIAKDSCAIVFGALLVSSVFSRETIQWYSVLMGFCLYIVFLFLTLFLKRKGNANG